MVGVPELIVMTILAMIYALALWKIFSKAGFPGIMSLVMSLITLIPFVNLISLLFLAFGDWPILKELKAAKQKVAS